MVCYAIPLAAALVASVVWGVQRRGPSGWWLNLLLYGAALFGVVDHLWHGELFLIGNAVYMDLFLGVTITAAIFGGWGATLGIARKYPALASRMGYRLGFVRASEKR